MSDLFHLASCFQVSPILWYYFIFNFIIFYCNIIDITLYKSKVYNVINSIPILWTGYLIFALNNLPRAVRGISAEFSSVQFSRLVMSNSLRPHGLQHTSPPHPSPTPTHIYHVGDSTRSSHPLSSSSPPTFNLSQHQGIFSESVLHIRWPKYWRFSVSISPSNEYLGLIFFRMHWLDLLAVQGTLKGLLQHHS